MGMGVRATVFRGGGLGRMRRRPEDVPRAGPGRGLETAWLGRDSVPGGGAAVVRVRTVLPDLWVISGTGGGRSFETRLGQSAHAGLAGESRVAAVSAYRGWPLAPIESVAGRLDLGPGRTS